MAHKYETIVNKLELDFINGKYKELKKLPTEEEFSKEFGVSRNTIRKAIEVLVNKGYIYQVQGSGIFIRENSRDKCIEVNNMKGLSRDFPCSVVKTEVLDLKSIKANDDIADRLKCKIDTEIYYVKRLRLVDGEPYVIEKSYFNKELIPYLNNDIISDSIYKYIQKDLKLNIGFADKLIYCRELINDEAKLLKLEDGQPALIIENTVYLSNGLIFDSSKSVFNYKKAKLITPANYK